MRKKIYIEFVGISGSGKSTLANKLESELIADNYDVLKIPIRYDKLRRSSILGKLTLLLWYFMKNIKSLIGVLQTYRCSKYDYTGSLYTLLRRKYSVENNFALNKQILINKEGTFQLYRSKGDRFRNTDLDSKYHSIFSCRNFGYLPVIVFLNIRTELAVLRCNRSRTSKEDPNSWSLHHLTKENQVDYMNKWHEKNVMIKNQLYISYEDVIVLEYDTSNNIDMTINQVKEKLL